MKVRLILSFLTLLLYGLSVQAEYRVYQYYVKSKDLLSTDQNAYLVTSSLAPTTYLAYHGGGQSIKIDLLRSWMCYGNTARKLTCPPPIERGLSSRPEQ